MNDDNNDVRSALEAKGMTPAQARAVVGWLEHVMEMWRHETRLMLFTFAWDLKWDLILVEPEHWFFRWFWIRKT